MSDRDIELLARKLVTLERQQNAASRATQLPQSSVRLTDGDVYDLAQGVEDAVDVKEDVAILNEYTAGVSEHVDEVIDYTIEIPEWIQEAGHAVDVAWDSTQFATDLALTLDTELRQVPAAATVPTLVSNVGGWDASGAVATVSVSWAAVELDTDGEPLEIARYEVFSGSRVLASVEGLSASFTIPASSVHQLVVRAFSSIDIPGDFSEPLEVTGATPELVELVPTAPNLRSGVGNVYVAWSGDYETEASAAAFSVQLEAREGIAGPEEGPEEGPEGDENPNPWEQYGAALLAAGTQTVRLGAVGGTVEVRFVAYDRLGRVTGISDVSQIVVVGVVGNDIEAASVTTNHIAAGSVTTDLLSPELSDTLALVAPTAIELSVIKDQQAIDSEAIERIGTVMRLTAEGLTISDPTAVNRLVFTDSGMEMMQGTRSTASLVNGVFVAEAAHLHEAHIGAHYVTQLAEQTVWRPIGGE